MLRVCDGPSCSSKGSQQVLEELYKRSTLIGDKGMKLFEVGSSDCINACKRSCNVALVMKGTDRGRNILLPRFFC